LHAATAAIQRGLTGADDRFAFHPGYAGRAPEKPWIDAESRVLGISDPEPIANHPDLEPPREIREPTGEQFQQHSFTCAAGTRQYKLFIPKVIWVGSCRCWPLPLDDRFGARSATTGCGPTAAFGDWRRNAALRRTAQHFPSSAFGEHWEPRLPANNGHSELRSIAAIAGGA
jgi:hypothetical protein